MKDKKEVVFHCALSQQRGPSAALRYIRERNRLLGIGGDDSGKDGKHSEESKQTVYILEGGFVKWQEKYVDLGQTTSRNYEADISKGTAKTSNSQRATRRTFGRWAINHRGLPLLSKYMPAFQARNSTLKLHRPPYRLSLLHKRFYPFPHILPCQ